MIRRLLAAGLLAYSAVLIARASAQRRVEKQSDRLARADWDSEGGALAPDPADSPAMS